MKNQLAAYKILEKVILEQGYCNVLIAQFMQKNKEQEADILEIEALVMNTLKNQIYLDYILKNIIECLKKVPDLSLKLTIFLWMSLYKIYFTVVNEEIFIQETMTNFKFIFAEETNFMLEFLAFCFFNFKSEFDLPKEKKLTIKLIKHSYPRWIYDLVKSQYSPYIAKQLMLDNIKKPIISFRVNTLKTTVKQVLLDPKYQEYNFHFSTLVNDGLISSKPIFDTKLYQLGQIIKQDQASMLVSHLLNPQPYDEILDMCAGIGSKTAHIAALMQNHGSITACDNKADRLEIAAKYFKKLGVKNTKIIVGDAINYDFQQHFDKILLDVPSTASGLIKRKPEVKLLNWTKEQIVSLINLQAQLLHKSYSLLKPHGILVYVTCTFNMKENQNQIEKFIKKFPKMIIVEEKQIFGFQEGTDGFYICKLKKKE